MSLTDGPKIYLTCANCRARLLEIWVVSPQEDSSFKVRATCPFCNDKSYIQEIKGGFRHSGAARPCEDDEAADFLATIVDKIDVVNDISIFNMRKAQPDARPIK
jgi:hypothetical protein